MNRPAAGEKLNVAGSRMKFHHRIPTIIHRISHSTRRRTRDGLPGAGEATDRLKRADWMDRPGKTETAPRQRRLAQPTIRSGPPPGTGALFRARNRVVEIALIDHRRWGRSGRGGRRERASPARRRRKKLLKSGPATADKLAEIRRLGRGKLLRAGHRACWTTAQQMNQL